MWTDNRYENVEQRNVAWRQVDDLKKEEHRYIEKLFFGGKCSFQWVTSGDGGTEGQNKIKQRMYTMTNLG